MSRTPEKIENGFAKFIRTVLIIAGVFFAIVTLGAIQNGGVFIIPMALSIGAFVLATKIKVTWKKDMEVSRYK